MNAATMQVQAKLKVAFGEGMPIFFDDTEGADEALNALSDDQWPPVPTACVHCGYKHHPTEPRFRLRHVKTGPVVRVGDWLLHGVLVEPSVGSWHCGRCGKYTFTKGDDL